MVWIYLLYYVLLVVLLVAGLAISSIGLPGLWLMVAASAFYCLITGGTVLSWPGVAMLTLLAFLAELAEFAAGAVGSKAAGGSKRALAGAVVGGLAGGLIGVPIPVVGPILGAILGAAIGAALLELTRKPNLAAAGGVAWGAAKGRFWGVAIKLGFGSAMLLLALVLAFPRRGDLPPKERPANDLPTIGSDENRSKT